MTIQIQINSVVLEYDEIQKHYPELAMMIQSSLPQGKKKKYKPRKKKQTVACLIDEIIENINTE